jgi:cytochrome c2
MSGKWTRVVVAIGTVVGLTAVTAGVNASAPETASADAVKGAKIYAAQKCSQCHKVGTVGGKLGPDLSLVGTRRDAAWMDKYLQDPKIIDPKNKMPKVKVKGQDLADLIAYLETLGKKK